MDPAQAAKLLGVDPATIERHIAEGLPTGPGGTLHLVTYAAWLIARERSGRMK
jgi:hypothetical protein